MPIWGKKKWKILMTEISQRQHLFCKAEEMSVLTGTWKIPSFFSFKLTMGLILLTLKDWFHYLLPALICFPHMGA